MAPFIAFLSDYGLDDEWVGVCRSVIARIAPEAQVVDLTHGVPRHAVLHGAVTLRNALPYLPEEALVFAVVDPEVGGERRGVAVRAADGRVLVGPDNGLLAPAVQRAGGPVELVEITRSRHRLEPVSATFHGRDVFSPVVAQLAAGAPLAGAGDPLDPEELRTLALPGPRVEGDELRAQAVTVDRFGNVALDATRAHLAATGAKLGDLVEAQGRAARYARTFADVEPDELLVYEDASDALALAVNRGSAAARLALGPGDDVRIRRAP